MKHLFESRCTEYFSCNLSAIRYGDGRVGECGRIAVHLVLDPVDDIYVPKCARCSRFYKRENVKPMTIEADARISELQRTRP